MTSSPPVKFDRLTAFLKSFELRTTVLPASETRPANLYIEMDEDADTARRVVFHPRETLRQSRYDTIAALVDFGGAANPLISSLPEELVFELEHDPALSGIASLFLAEARERRCGGNTVMDRLCEVIVVMAMRRAIDAGAVGRGLLAGLAHPSLHRAMSALHAEPAKPWRIEELASVAGMSRSHFMAQFSAIVGATPSNYLNAWRLTLGHRQMALGRSVKQAAQCVGFGSASAFSRAFSRAYGYSPVEVSAKTG
jgi:AraC-like DNA-binding protein